MKALVITGSRADRNCMEPVHDALVEAGHESELAGNFQSILHAPDVAVIGGDRYEILLAACSLAVKHIPIAHIAGGDVTEGSADDRYRDAISALACIHCVTNYDAFGRVWDKLKHRDDDVQLTGSPALDRIYAMPRLGGAEVMNRLPGLNLAYKTIVIAVHPNTMPRQDPLMECKAIIEAIDRLPSVNVVALGANADPGGDSVDHALQLSFGDRFHKHLDPQLYYSLLEGAHMMVGNSSAGLYEAPIFGLPYVLVGDRQQGRRLPENVIPRPVGVNAVLDGISTAFAWGRLTNVRNPYGDGHSAPRIVRCLEDNQWRWAKL